MSTDGNSLKQQDLTHKIIGVFFSVSNELGPGFSALVYVEAMTVALRSAGLKVSARWRCQSISGIMLLGQLGLIWW